MCQKRSAVLGAVLLTTVHLGCGPGGPEIAPVEGTIMLDGQPLANAAVVFIPDDGRPAGATTDSQGKYVLNFTEGRQGAIPGKNRVRITTQRDASETPSGEPIPASPERIPLKYQTTLTFDVEPRKKNVANFELESGGPIAAPDEYD